MLWWRNLGPSSEGFVLKIERLTPVDCRETGAVDDRIARSSDKVAVVLSRATHPETFVRCEERPLHFVDGSRKPGSPTLGPTG